VTQGFVARYGTRLGYRIFPWTVDDPTEAQRLARLGVEGIITNDPELVREAIRG